MIEDLVCRLGLSKLIYGGAFGSLAIRVGYRVYLELVRSYLANLSHDDQEELVGGREAKFFGSINVEKRPQDVLN